MVTKEEWESTLITRHGKELQQAFSKATVAICGLGGLGSNIAIALARAGIGKLILCDFDKVDLSNLHRQQYKMTQIGRYKTEALEENLKEINPFLEMELHTERITAENGEKILKNATIVCEAFDEATCKAMLTEVVLGKLPKAYLIAASGMAGIDSGNKIITRKVLKRCYICGDGMSDVDDGMGLISPRVMLCAAHQALMVLRILANQLEV